jgi:hypothetical protein
MGSGHQHSLSQWFDKLIDLDPEDRQEILDNELAADDELRGNLEALLNAKDESTPKILDSRLPMGFASTITTASANTLFSVSSAAAAWESCIWPGTAGWAGEWR